MKRPARLGGLAAGAALVTLLLVGGCTRLPASNSRSGPQRVILICVDTLRADHLGIHGYGRNTTPALDRFAHTGVSFDHALSSSPWALPALRSAITGRHAEEFDSARTLPELLGEQGYATAMFSATSLFSAEHDMQRGWDLLQVADKAPAANQVDQALAWLDLVADQDALLFVHLADTRLPYQEPESHRWLFAGDAVPPLGESFQREMVIDSRIANPFARQYLVGRYDNNLRYLDDQLARLLESLREDDIVIFFSDHGEEFWDHGGFGHGHSLHHEVLHVPLIVRAPGYEPGRIPTPVSLLDITPTVLGLLGLDATFDGLDGQSLLAALEGRVGAIEELAERPIVFGRPLYGPLQWGVQTGLEKYITTQGVEMLFDLASDPMENSNLIAGREWVASEEYRRQLGLALGREMAIGFSLAAFSPAGPSPTAVVAELTLDGGPSTMWVGDQPTVRALSWAWPEDGKAVARWESGFHQGHQIVVIPEASIGVAARQIHVHITAGEQAFDLPIELSQAQRSGADRRRLGGARLPGGLLLALDYCIAPLPAADTSRMPGLRR